VSVIDTVMTPVLPPGNPCLSALVTSSFTSRPQGTASSMPSVTAPTSSCSATRSGSTLRDWKIDIERLVTYSLKSMRARFSDR